MEDWDSLQCDSTKEFSCHSPTQSFVYQFVTTTVKEASGYKEKIIKKIKGNYHIAIYYHRKWNFISVYDAKVSIAAILNPLPFKRIAVNLF